jgi:hypothetical protein
MREPPMYTVNQLCDILHIARRTVYRWIRVGHLDADRVDGLYTIPSTTKNTDFIVAIIRNRHSRPESAWVPEGLTDYHGWHQLIDEFVWLVKACYSDKEDLKRKRFRLDRLLANYLRANNVTLGRIKHTFAASSASPPSQVADDLKRGWYNEFAYAVPQKPSTLGHSFSDIELNKATSASRFAFPSWRITTAYYTVYFYLRAITLLKQHGFRLEQHGATIAVFKNAIASPLGRSLWQFPFNLAYHPGIKVYRKRLLLASVDHAEREYARHPRAPHRSPHQIFDYIYRVFTARGRAGAKPRPYSIFDYLHDFRVWANYLDIDNLLSLWGAGYKAFLDHNLSLVLFFVGAMAELCYMAVLGTKEYMRQLQRLYELFAANNPELRGAFINTPLSQRLQVYRALGIVTDELVFQEEENINRVITL